MDRIAGVIEVTLTDDGHEVVISYSNSRPDVEEKHKIVIMPRQARHLAHVLMEYAELAEDEARAEDLRQMREKRSSHLPIACPDGAEIYDDKAAKSRVRYSFDHSLRNAKG